MMITPATNPISVVKSTLVVLSMMLAMVHAAADDTPKKCMGCQEPKDLVRLGCNHAILCRGCMNRYVESKLNDPGSDVKRITCLKCTHVVTEAEIREYCPKYIKHYVRQKNYVPERGEGTETDRLTCCPNCATQLFKPEHDGTYDGGQCNHMSCDCGTEFCWLCREIFEHGNYGAHYTTEKCCTMYDERYDYTKFEDKHQYKIGQHVEVSIAGIWCPARILPRKVATVTELKGGKLQSYARVITNHGFYQVETLDKYNQTFNNFSPSDIRLKTNEEKLDETSKETDEKGDEPSKKSKKSNEPSKKWRKELGRCYYCQECDGSGTNDRGQEAGKSKPCNASGKVECRYCKGTGLERRKLEWFSVFGKDEQMHYYEYTHSSQHKDELKLKDQAPAMWFTKTAPCRDCEAGKLWQQWKDRGSKEGEHPKDDQLRGKSCANDGLYCKNGFRDMVIYKISDTGEFINMRYPKHRIVLESYGYKYDDERYCYTSEQFGAKQKLCYNFEANRWGWTEDAAVSTTSCDPKTDPRDPKNEDFQKMHQRMLDAGLTRGSDGWYYRKDKYGNDKPPLYKQPVTKLPNEKNDGAHPTEATKPNRRLAALTSYSTISRILRAEERSRRAANLPPRA